MNIIHFIVFFTYSLILCVFLTFIYLVGVHEQLTCSVCDGYEKIESSYDYIIVGAGSAGSIMALRLLENGNKSVLLIEAGGEGNMFFDIPIIGPLLQRTSVDWQYETIPQEHSAYGLKNNVAKIPSGRIVGGTGKLNNMIYLRGHSTTYSNWFKDQKHFNYDSDVLQYFKKSEDLHTHYQYDFKHHSQGGPLKVQNSPFYSCLTKHFLKAVKSLGFPIQDLNANKLGFMKVQLNSNFGKRWTPYHHLSLNKRSNLQILTSAEVHQILFKHNYEAYAVKLRRLNRNQVITARKGIILSAGTIGSPRILLSSGVGPKEHLQKIGLDVIKDLPVGENLQDHVTTGLDLILLNQSVGVNLNQMISPFSIFDYFFHSTGPWTSAGCEVVGLIASEGIPDLQLMVLPAGISGDGGYYLKDNFGIKDNVWKEYFEPLIGQNTITILPVVLAAKSRGWVRLSGKKWNDKILINPNYLQHPDDLKVLLKGIDLIKQIINTKAMEELGAKLNTKKFPGCEDYTFDTTDYWICYFKQLTLTAYHHVGTCKMGLSTDSVVDYGFRVKGLNKLYVVDASVIPQLPSANTNAAVVMLAEKAAESILLHDANSNSCSRQDVLFL